MYGDCLIGMKVVNWERFLEWGDDKPKKNGRNFQAVYYSSADEQKKNNLRIFRTCTSGSQGPKHSEVKGRLCKWNVLSPCEAPAPYVDYLYMCCFSS